MPRILPPTEPSVARAAERLRVGAVVAFPTETVYGLGAGTFNTVALGLVYELKGRPANNPLIAHVLDGPHARTLVTTWDQRCDALANRFWPGPLTLV
ncbi:MAG: Sua5/YciO/YrdC/YwlC family protein, partial [Phycisphaerales bacterium]|nr:Sua5/YciO/YrdC/YwlC family protein [Phycisphaerales bacterium]MCI0675975.1 Sua5/YciO/YrdC/YwlC family protein [Phycisphaerales bacterium]